jgi:hypothetical protein
MFSKRHYEAVAAVLLDINRDARAYDGVEMWEAIRDRLSDLFEADNPQDGKGRGFKRDKWEEACDR